jgi:hypothetical protein
MNTPVRELIEFDLVDRMKLRSRKTGFYIDKNNENTESENHNGYSKYFVINKEDEEYLINYILRIGLDKLSYYDWRIIFDYDEGSKVLYSEEFLNKIDLNNIKDVRILDNISCNQNLSEEFIIKYKHKLNLTLIFKYQSLSEEFLIKNKHLYEDKEYCWVFIIQYQKLSFEFLIDNYKYIDNFIKYLLDNKLIDRDIKDKFVNFSNLLK